MVVDPAARTRTTITIAAAAARGRRRALLRIHWHDVVCLHLVNARDVEHDAPAARVAEAPRGRRERVGGDATAKCDERPDCAARRHPAAAAAAATTTSCCTASAGAGRGAAASHAHAAPHAQALRRRPYNAHARERARHLVRRRPLDACAALGVLADGQQVHERAAPRRRDRGAQRSSPRRRRVRQVAQRADRLHLHVKIEAEYKYKYKYKIYL